MMGTFEAYTGDTWSPIRYAIVPPVPGARESRKVYRVGSDGSFWSRPKDRPGPWRPLQAVRTAGGYLQVKTGQGPENLRYLHRIILEAFVGPCPPGLEVLHHDDVKTDNRLPNLRYGTRLENAADRIRNGRPSGGSRRLRAEEAIAIVRRRRAGEMVKVLAREFGVTRGTIHKLLAGRSLGRITGIEPGQLVRPGLVAA